MPRVFSHQSRNQLRKTHKLQEAYDLCFKTTGVIQLDQYRQYLNIEIRQEIFDLLQAIGDELELEKTSVYLPNLNIKHKIENKTLITNMRKY